MRNESTYKERYGYIGINGLYYVYDHKYNNIPSGYGTGHTKSATLKIVELLNKQESKPK